MVNVVKRPNVPDALADLEEKVFAERLKQRRARLDKLTEGKSKRFRRRMERVEMARSEYDLVRVRVLPANDEMRKILQHPVGNLGFHEHGSVEWPLDSFTEKRIRDGDVTLESVGDTEARQQRRAAPPLPPRPRPTPPGTGPAE